MKKLISIFLLLLFLITHSQIAFAKNITVPVETKFALAYKKNILAK